MAAYVKTTWVNGSSPAINATNLNKIEQGIFDSATKSVEDTKTLVSTSWTGASAPYSYSLSVTGVTTTSNQELLPSLTISEAELLALQLANIVDVGQSAGTILLKAWGDKPSINIPIRVILRGDA